MKAESSPDCNRRREQVRIEVEKAAIVNYLEDGEDFMDHEQFSVPV